LSTLDVIAESHGARGNLRGRFGYVMCDVLKQQVTSVGGYKVRCN